MNYSMSYTQYRERKSLRYRAVHYLPYGFLMVSAIAVLIIADQLRIDWSRLLFNEIKYIRVEGEYKRIDRFEIEQLLSPFIDHSIGRTEMGLIEKTLKDLPWVKHVLIKRSWLDETLVVSLQEREAVAYWGGRALLDTEGEVFRPRLIANDNLPILEAQTNREKEMLHFYNRLTDWLAPIGSRIVYLREDPSRTYTVQLENMPRLILGRHLFEDRINRFVAAYYAGLSDYMHHIACIDLRYLDGFSASWKQNGVSQSC